METREASAVQAPERPGSEPWAGDEPGRRGQIVRAATIVLSRKGYGETSLKDVAREAGVAPGLLHYYFESKQELLLEVVVALEREMTRDWQAAVSELDDPLERIVAALDHAAHRCSEQPEFFRLLFDLYDLGLTSPAIRVRCAEMWQRFIDDIEAEVRQVLGRLPAYALVPPRDLAGAIAGAIDGIALSGLVLQQSPRELYHALKVLLLSVVVTAYVTAGQEPPVARLAELLARHS
ncbi:MAG TPA: TetR/AcrR family transcriptional regulator [Candidatus Dormibacteraeota bacterium]|nr:TetR/AcrR family transcriptional regulator [Candidatus Dormibacteraeota bacterium]